MSTTVVTTQTSSVRVTAVTSVVRVTALTGSEAGGTVIIRPSQGAVVRVSRFGIQGPPGKSVTIDGASVATFEWSPPSAQATWVIAHNLGKYPSVTVVDGESRKIEPEITYPDNNLVVLNFAYPTHGRAFLN